MRALNSRERIIAGVWGGAPLTKQESIHEWSKCTPTLPPQSSMFTAETSPTGKPVYMTMASVWEMDETDGASLHAP